MAKKKTSKTNDKLKKVNEPSVAYAERRIVFFNSFEEENIHVAKERAEVCHTQRMINVEHLRKHVFNNYLLPNDSWAPIENIFKIMPPYTNDISK